MPDCLDQILSFLKESSQTKGDLPSFQILNDSSLWSSKADSHPLCSLLTPIGEHKPHPPSKGKRAKKRKRRGEATIQNKSANFPNEGVSGTGALAQPEIQEHLTIGFNTTTRFLEFLAQQTRPGSGEDEDLNPVVPIENPNQPSFHTARIEPLAAVFALRSGQPPVLYAHLPLLVRAANLAVPSSTSTRLISLPEGAEVRLKSVLGIPRVGMIGLMNGAPNASSLVEFIRANVPEMEVPWLQEAIKGEYLPVKINAIQTFAPRKRKQKVRPSTAATAVND